MIKLRWDKVDEYQKLHNLSDEEMAKGMDIHVTTLRRSRMGETPLTTKIINGAIKATKLDPAELLFWSNSYLQVSNIREAR